MARWRGAAPLVGLITAGAAVGGCGPDPGQMRLCERVIAAMEEDRDAVTIVRRAAHPGAGSGVVIDYRVSRDEAAAAIPHPDGRRDRRRDHAIDLGEDGSEAHWVACRFSGGLFSADRLTLAEVSTDRRGRLSVVDLEMLRIWLRLERRDG